MDSNKSQKEINREEWENPDNWSGTWLFRVYFSKRDSRLWTTMWHYRFGPSMINLGHRWGFFMLSLLFYGLIALVACIGWTEGHRN